MVLRSDDRLVPEFLKALEENGQGFLADKLRETGMLLYDRAKTYPGMTADADGVEICGIKNLVMFHIFRRVKTYTHD